MSVMDIAGIDRHQGQPRTKCPILKLVPKSSPVETIRSEETTKALQQLAELAAHGEILGFAYVVLRPKKRVTVGTVGVSDEEMPLLTYWLQKLNLILLEG